MVRHNNHLRRLNLSDNDVGAVGARLIADALKVNMSLEHLDLAKNNLGEDGAVYVAEALAVNVRLCGLDISYNGVGDAGATALARAIDKNKSLTLLDVTANQYVSALGAWYLSVAAKCKPTGWDRRLRYRGLPSHLQVTTVAPIQ